MCEDNRRGKPRRAEIIAFNGELAFLGIHHGAVNGHRRGSRAGTAAMVAIAATKETNDFEVRTI